MSAHMRERVWTGPGVGGDTAQSPSIKEDHQILTLEGRKELLGEQQKKKKTYQKMY